MAIPRSLMGTSSSSVKSHNRRAILLTLLRHEPVSRAHIAQLTQLSASTVTNLIAELIQQGIIVEKDTRLPDHERGVGRPRIALHLVPGARFAVGIYIGIGKARVGLTDLFACPLRVVDFNFPVECPAEEVLAEVVQRVKTLIHGLDQERIIGAGVGATGMIQWETGVNVFAPSLDWHNVSIRERLETALGLPVFVDNNVRGMALAETLFGAGKNVEVLAFVYARTGVGAGFTIGGQLYRGGTGAGEIGHMAILADRGEPCHCGSTGCLETLVSEPAIVRMAQELAAYDRLSTLAKHLQRADAPVLECIFDAAREDDPAAQTLLAERARYMGIGLANLVNMISPEVIVLGGIFAQGKDLLFPMTEDTLRKRAFAKMGEHVRLLTPTFGEEAGVAGAAALALNAFFYEQSEGVLF